MSIKGNFQTIDALLLMVNTLEALQGSVIGRKKRFSTLYFVSSKEDSKNKIS